jgi:general secretion pathway protein G
MANFIGVRQRARDAQRKSDLRQVQAALEIYRSDIGSYPSVLKNCGSALGNIGSGSPDCSTTYMQKIPGDSSGSSYYNGGDYVYQSVDNVTYVLGACLENSGDSQATINNPGGSGTCSSGKYYVLNNP